MIEPIVIEWTALSVGTAGTVLWALGKNQLSVSVLWMLSSILWIVFALTNGHYGLTARDMLGILLYAVGIRTYWISRRKETETPKHIEVLHAPDSVCRICGGAGVHQLSGPGTSLCSCTKGSIVRLTGH